MKSGQPTKSVTKFALILPLILISCASPTSTAALDGHASFCDIAKVISFDRLHDTAETIAQVKEHNAVYSKLCMGR